MISQLTVENFQSIEKATLDLSAVNLVVGRNYSGKSALAIRALYALATNRSGDDFIQQGAKQARVSLVLDDGQEITWTKAKGKGGEKKTLHAWGGGTRVDVICQWRKAFCSREQDRKLYRGEE